MDVVIEEINKERLKRLKAVIVQRIIAFMTAYFMVQISWSKFTISNRVILWPEIHLGHLAISLTRSFSLIYFDVYILGVRLSRADRDSHIGNGQWEVIAILRLNSVGGIQEHAHPNTVLGKGEEAKVQIPFLLQWISISHISCFCTVSIAKSLLSWLRPLQHQSAISVTFWINSGSY